MMDMWYGSSMDTTKATTYRQLVAAEVTVFIDTQLVADPGGRIASGRMYAHFTAWWEARDLGERPWKWRFSPPVPSQRAVTVALANDIPARRTMNGTTFLGVAFV
jgi:hypothetical protein